MVAVCLKQFSVHYKTKRIAFPRTEEEKPINWMINEENRQVDGANKFQDLGEKVNQPTKYKMSGASSEVN